MAELDKVNRIASNKDVPFKEKYECIKEAINVCDGLPKVTALSLLEKIKEYEKEIETLKGQIRELRESKLDIRPLQPALSSDIVKSNNEMLN